MHHRLRTASIVAALLAGALAAAHAARADIVYLYDDLGRLARVIRDDGEAASFHYDAVGNILRITRESGVPQATSVATASASRGAQGARVTVTLTGVNLAGATLSSATGGISFENIHSDFDELTFDVVIAPAADLGPITIDIAGAPSATQITFTVEPGATPQPPTITTFSPASGRVGDLVTIDGTGLDEAQPSNNAVRFNGTLATVVTATSTRLTARVPAGATTGPISVTTANGTTTSGEVFTIVQVALAATLAAPFDAPTDLALSPDGRRAYVPNSRGNTVSVIDTATHAIVAGVQVAAGPFAVAVSPDGGRLYALGSDADLGNSVVSVVDATTNTGLTDIALATFSGQQVAVSPDGASVFVLGSDATLTVIDTATETVVATITVPDFAEALTVSPTGPRLAVLGNFDNALAFVDPAAQTVVATLTIAPDATAGVFSADGTRFYQPTGGDLQVVDVATGTVAVTIAGGGGMVAMNPVQPRLYAASVAFDPTFTIPTTTVTVIDTLTNAVVTSLTLPEIYPAGLTVAPDGRRLLVFSDARFSHRDSVAVIDAAANTLTATVPLDGESAIRAAVFPSGAMAYLLMATSSSISVVDLAAAGVIDAPISRTGVGIGFWFFTPLVFGGDGHTAYGSSGDTGFFDAGFVSSFDTVTLQAGRNYTMPHDLEHSSTRSGISAMATDPTGATLFVATRDLLHFVDRATAALVATVTMPRIALRLLPSADGSRVVAVADNAVIVVDTASHAVVATLDLGAFIDSVASNDAGTRLYLGSANSNRVFVVDPAGPTLVATLVTGRFPNDLAASPDDRKVFVRNLFDGTVSIIETASGNTVATLPFPSGTVRDLAATPIGPAVFVADGLNSRITVIDVATNAVTNQIPVPATPTDLTVSPDGQRLWVVQRLSGLVTIVDTRTQTVIGTVTVPLSGQLRKAAVLPSGRGFVPSFGPSLVPNFVYVIE